MSYLMKTEKHGLGIDNKLGGQKGRKTGVS
jgi:hypothetical protein